MTTEDDFQAALDAQPSDWQTRLVLADFLQEQGDPRADGYRALAAQRRSALPCQMAGSGDEPGPVLFIVGNDKVDVKEFRRKYAACILPTDWFDLVTGGLYQTNGTVYWAHFRTRRAAEDAAARAFAELPEARRVELAVPPAEPDVPDTPAAPPKRKRRRK